MPKDTSGFATVQSTTGHRNLPVQTQQALFRETTFMPLTNTPFAPGQCLEAVEFLAGGAQQDIAWAEYYYFSGQPEKAIEKAQPYLASEGALVATGDASALPVAILFVLVTAFVGAGTLILKGSRS